MLFTALFLSLLASHSITEDTEHHILARKYSAISRPRLFEERTNITVSKSELIPRQASCDDQFLQPCDDNTCIQWTDICCFTGHGRLYSPSPPTRMRIDRSGTNM